MRKARILTITIIAVLLLVCAFLGFVYFFSDLFRSNKYLFGRYASEIDLFSILDTEFYEQYNNKIIENKYEKEGDLTLKATTKSEELEYAKLTYNTKENQADQMLQTDVGINIQEQEVLGFTVLRNNDLYGITIQDIVNKFLVVENKNIKEFAGKFNIDSRIPDKIEINSNTGNYFTEQENAKLKGLFNKCINEIYAQIPSKNYSKTGTSTIELDGKNVNVNGYKVVLNVKESYELLIRILEIIKNDETIFNILKNRLNSEEIITKEDYGNAVEDLINKVTDDLNSTGEFALTKDSFAITVYENKKQFVNMVFETFENENSLSGSIRNSGNKIILDLKKGVNYNFSETEKYNGEINLKLTKTTTNNQSHWVCDIEEKQGGLTRTQVTISFIRIGEVSSNNIRHSMDISIKMPFSVELKVLFNENTKFTSRVDIEKFNSDNHVLLNVLSNEDLQLLFNLIAEKVKEKMGIEEIVQQIMSDIMLNSFELTEEDVAKAKAQAIQMFNAKFEGYAGTQKSAPIKALMTTISSNNATYPEHQVEIGGIANTPEDVQNMVNSGKQYIVTFSYTDGYITKANVEEQV